MYIIAPPFDTTRFKHAGGASCDANYISSIPFEPTSKRRKGFPSETKVKCGHRIVHGKKELREKLGRNDLCPCGSTRRFQELLYEKEAVRRFTTKLLLLGTNRSPNKELNRTPGSLRAPGSLAGARRRLT